MLDKYIGGYWNWLKDGGILTNIKSDKITLILTPFHILIFLISLLCFLILCMATILVPVSFVYGILQFFGLTGDFELLAIIIPILFFVRYWPH